LGDDFNPYRQWLGFAEDRAPNYYELLSLDPHETDPARISAAAARATTKVRSFRPGSQAPAWSRLLDEIQAAKACISDPAKRAEYDSATLHRRPNEPLGPVPALPPPELSPLARDLYPPGRINRPDSDEPARSTAKPRAAPFAEENIVRHYLPTPLQQTITQTPADADPAFVEIVPEELLPPSAAPIEALTPPAALPSDAAIAHAAPVASASTLPAALPGLPVASPARGYVAGAAAAPVARPVAMPLPSHTGDYLPSGSLADPAVRTAVTVHLADMVARGRDQRRWGLLFVVSGVLALLLAVAAAVYVVQSKFGSRGVPIVEAPVAPEMNPPVAAAPVMPPSAAPVSPRELERAPAPMVPATSVVESPPAPAQKSPRSEPATTPTSDPPAPMPPAVSRSDVAALVKALETAKLALGEQNFDVSDEQIALAESLAKLPKHQDAVKRLKEVVGYVKQFRRVIEAVATSMQAGETFKVGSSTQVSFVEGSADKVVLRISGMNRTFPLGELPAGLALAMADLRLASDDSVGRVVKGAYLSVHKQADDEKRDKARSLWEEAQSMGADLMRLMPFLADDYAKLIDDAAP
jgi:hypothetical protein